MVVPWTVPSADPEGGRGSGPPLENHKLYIFYREKAIGPPPLEKVGSPPPLENVGPPQEPCKLIVLYEINLPSVK